MIYDISQEVFSCHVFPGDPQPAGTRVMQIDHGDLCNLTELSMCVHNGTHIDAPFHFLRDGKTVDQIALSRFVGRCFVTRHSGDLTAQDAEAVLAAAAQHGAAERILIAGSMTVTEEAASVFAAAGILLYGNESQTVGPADAPAAVHRIMLGAEIVLLEGIVLEHVPEGVYFLSAAPLNLGGCDGAPCRAYLTDSEAAKGV